MARCDRLAVDHLTAGYGASVAIREVAVRVAPGEAVALLGRNGAGKSTTLMAIAGALRAMSGSVQIDGRAVTSMPSYRVARAGLSLVPQGRRIFATLSVRENLTLASRGGNLAEVYSLFPVLGIRSASAGSALSGGEQQLLAIGRGLMAEPKLIILDEPSLGLSPLLVEELFALIQSINAEGIAILLVEQNVVQSLDVAQRAYVLDNGHFVLQGDVATLRDNPDLKRTYLGM